MRNLLTATAITTVLLALSAGAWAEAPKRPLKVYILAGQSNMEGHAEIRTFPAIDDDPKTAPLLKQMLDENGKPVVCERVWITYPAQQRHGKLTARFGPREDRIGPEFTFGITMQKHVDGPILLIKTAWGGKSLHTDFRPPSAGPYKLSSFQKAQYPKQQGHGIPKDFEKWKADKVKATGHYYSLMLADIKNALKDIKSVYPGYDPSQGYELAGFVWFQGWNDYCDGHVYPDGRKPGGYDLYTRLIAHFIRDVRKDLSAPKLPFIIGVFGVRGLIDPDKRTVHFRQAMTAPAQMPEFKGNVVAVPTAPYWQEALEPIYWKKRRINSMHGKLHGKEMEQFKAKTITPAEEALWKRGGSNGDYHYLGSAKTFAQIGGAFAEAMLKMAKKRTPATMAAVMIDSIASQGGLCVHVGVRDGKHVWAYKYSLIRHGGRYWNTLGVGGLIWVHNAESTGGREGWEGLNPQTGEVVKTFTGPKMGHRCSADTASPNFIICGSFDFADLHAGEFKKFYPVRNGCGAGGVVPANRMVYTFPHGCRCRNWVRGFVACAATETPGDGAATRTTSRLQKGPAFGATTGASKQSTLEWPTYRHDAGRSAATACEGPQRLGKLWETQVTAPAIANQAEWDLADGGRMTAPVVAQGLVFVAAIDQHTLKAFDAKTGAPRWSFTAGGRIDCPPTIYRGMCMVGSRDGWVYCLTADEGRLMWRYLAAPRESRIVYYGQMESVWPVAGGVLIYDGLAYFAAGRHADIDGGIVVSAVEPKTGKLVWTQNQRQRGTPEIHRSTPDVMIGRDGNIEMGPQSFSAKTGRVTEAQEDRFRAGRLGLLSDAWYTRGLALRSGLSELKGPGGTTGQLISFNDSAAVWFKTGTPSHANGELSGTASLSAKSNRGKEWTIAVPVKARPKAMVLTPTRIYVAGLSYDSEKDDSPSNAVRIYSLADGALLGKCEAKDQFIHDCLAVSGKRLYATTQSGEIICLGAKK